MSTSELSLKNLRRLGGREAVPPVLSSLARWLASPYVWMAVVALILRVGLILWMDNYDFASRKWMMGEDRFPWAFAQCYDFPFPDYRADFIFGYETGSIARSIATGEGFASPFAGHTGPTAWLAPAYPYLVAGVFVLFGVYSNTSGFVLLFLNSLFAALTCMTIYFIGVRTLGRRVGLWAGWGWAVVPFFMQWATTWVWEMALSAFLVSALFLYSLRLGGTASKKHWLGFGLLWGLAALTNPALLSFLPFSLAWPAYQLRRQGQKWPGLVGWATLACVLVVTPWLVRNWVVFDQPLFIRGNFWFEFRMGNYDHSNAMGWWGKHPTGNPWEFEDYKEMGELAYVDRAKTRSLMFLEIFPDKFWQLTLKRIAYFWDGTPVPYTEERIQLWQPWLVLIFSVLALLGLLLAIIRKVRGAYLFAFLLFSYPLVYYITFVQIRYRHALEPALLLLAVYFLYETLRSLRPGSVEAERNAPEAPRPAAVS